MILEIQDTNWAKRRKPSAIPQPISATIPNLELTREHHCRVFVTFSDEAVRELRGRVIYNEIKQTWSISAIANGGWMVSIAVKE